MCTLCSFCSVLTSWTGSSGKSWVTWHRCICHIFIIIIIIVIIVVIVSPRKDDGWWVIDDDNKVSGYFATSLLNTALHQLVLAKVGNMAHQALVRCPNPFLRVGLKWYWSKLGLFFNMWHRWGIMWRVKGPDQMLRVLSVLKNISNPPFMNVAVMGKSKCYQILQERIKFPVWCTLPSFLHQSPISKVYRYHNSKHCQVPFGEDIVARIKRYVLACHIYNVSTREDCCPFKSMNKLFSPKWYNSIAAVENWTQNML